MVIPAERIDENCRPAEAQLAADFDGPHDRLERRGQVILGRKQSVHRRTETRIGSAELLLDELLRAIALFGNLRKALNQQVRVLLFQGIAQSRVLKLKWIARRAIAVSGKR